MTVPSHGSAVLVVNGNTMPGMGKNLQCDGNTIRLQALSKRFRLLYRHAFILRTVQ
jgi:hypothetical protein